MHTKIVNLDNQPTNDLPVQAQIELGLLDETEVNLESPTVLKRLSERGVIKQNIFGGWVFA